MDFGGRPGPHIENVCHGLDFVLKNFNPGNGPFGSEYLSVGGVRLQNMKVTCIYKRISDQMKTDLQQGSGVSFGEVSTEQGPGAHGAMTDV